MEGLDRFKWGLKKAGEFKSLGKRSTTHVQIMEDGPLKGVYCKFTPKPEADDLDIEPLPQVGFALEEDGPFDWFLLDQLPTKRELGEMKGYEAGAQVCLRVWGISLEEALPILDAKGYPRGEHTGQTMPNQGRVLSDVVFQISHPEWRAVAKIAFNYLAYVAGANFALLPNFNEVRRYVRHDDRPDSRLVKYAPPVHVERQSKGRAFLAHFVTVERHGDSVIGQVSLLCRFRYAVLLSRGGLTLNFPLRSGHIFDLEDRKVVPISPPPLQ